MKSVRLKQSLRRETGAMCLICLLQGLSLVSAAVTHPGQRARGYHDKSRAGVWGGRGVLASTNIREEYHGKLPASCSVRSLGDPKSPLAVAVNRRLVDL